MEKILEFLGFDRSIIDKEIREKVEASTSEIVIQEEKVQFIPSAEADKMILRAVMVGNFENAVQISMLSGRMDDALVLAACGGEKLWTQTRNKYLQTAKKNGALNVLSSVLNGKIDELIEQSDLDHWKDTLAIICSFGKEKFTALADLLAKRLEQVEGNGDSVAAIFCYMCSQNVDKVIGIWLTELNSSTPSTKEQLIDFIEKVTLLQQVKKSSSVGRTVIKVTPDLLEKYGEYATLLAEQGQLSIALRYLNLLLTMTGELSQALSILRFRVYYALSNPSGDVPNKSPFIVKKIDSFNEKVNLMSSQQQQTLAKQQEQTTPVMISSSNGSLGNISAISEFETLLTSSQKQQQLSLTPVQNNGRSTTVESNSIGNNEFSNGGNKRTAVTSDGGRFVENVNFNNNGSTAKRSSHRPQQMTEEFDPFGTSNKPSTGMKKHTTSAGTPSSAMTSSSSTPRQLPVLSDIAAKVDGPFESPATSLNTPKNFPVGSVGGQEPRTSIGGNLNARMDENNLMASTTGSLKNRESFGNSSGNLFVESSFGLKKKPDDNQALRQTSIPTHHDLVFDMTTIHSRYQPILKILQKSFNAAFSNPAVASVDSNMTKKRLIENGLNLLYQDCGMEKIPDDLLNELLRLCDALSNGDYTSAEKTIKGISTEFWDDANGFIKGLKFLTQVVRDSK